MALYVPIVHLLRHAHWGCLISAACAIGKSDSDSRPFKRKTQVRIPRQLLVHAA
jgi:hypothetical protein